MGYFWLFALAALVTLDRVRRMDIDSTVRAHQFRLYALRDELREAAMTKQVNPQHWVFLYLDSSLAKTINVLSRITLWHVLLTGLTAQRDEGAQRAVAHLQAELSKPVNQALKEFHNRYLIEVGRFLIARHTTVKIVLSNILVAIRVGKYIRQQLNRLIEYQMATRETSTLRDFVHT